jgi:alpha-L-fucosidase 2
MQPFLRSFVCALSFLVANSLRADPGPMILWYTNASANWTEALPVGNGKLAAMVFGGITNDQIQFNEDTIWTGQPHDYAHAGASNYLGQIRNDIFTSNNPAAWTVASANFMSVPLRQCAFQPAGDLWMTFAHSGATNYRRWLDLDTATAHTRYDFGGITFEREVFASLPDQVIAVHLTASQPGQLTISYQFTSEHSNQTVHTFGNDLVMHVAVTNQSPSYNLASVIQFESRVRILAEGGSVTNLNGVIQVTQANSATLLLSVASSFVNYHDVSGDPAAIVSNIVSAASAKTYDDLRQAQLADYQALFHRVALDLGTSTLTNFPIDQRIVMLKTNNDAQLLALYFQMARYLMISGSRPGSQPLNLQGKWNNVVVPNWESKMTLNINEEMNYWAAEVCNLPECHEPLFDMIGDLAVTGQSVAQTHYNSRGWVVHHNTDLWRGAAPINGADGVWPTGGAWLCQHLWWHYQYSGDTNFLASQYAIMKSAAEFFQDFLVAHPRYGWMVTNPSYSPEHDEPGFGSNVAGPTMDNQLIRDLFNHVIQASEILGVDSSFRTNLMALRDQLPPNQIGKYGQLQEWLEDVDVPNDAHRHMSPLVGLFPGEEISPTYDPVIAAAAKVLVEWRGDVPTDKGWAKAWRMCIRDRLLDGDHAYLLLTNAVNRNVSNDLLFNKSDTQIDVTFGLLAGVAEMFLQSQSGELFLLPALPSEWPAGSVTGLRARGGFDVDIQWQSNRLSGATIHSRLGNLCRVRTKWPVSVKCGTNYIDAPMVLPGLYEFSTTAGTDYSIVPANVAEAELLSATTSAGDALSVVTDSTFSNGRGTFLNANAPGDFVRFTVTNLSAGNYRVQILADAGTNRGSFQLSCGPAGSLTNLGPVQDTFSPTNFVTLFATNMLREFDCGTWLAPSNGSWQFQFTVVDRNPASTGYALLIDAIKFTPVSSAILPPAPILSAQPDNGAVVLSWPADAMGFSLECVADLSSTNWLPASPSPVVVGGQNVVTNALSGDRKFYRLKKF